MDPVVEPVALNTARLQLDQPTSDDAAAITAICSGASITRWIPVMPRPYLVQHAAFFVDEFVPHGWATGTELTWVLRLPDGLVIGSVGVNLGREEVNYWLGERHRGRGYMQEALRAVLKWWFSQGAVRVRWRCLRGNWASARVARAAGFRFQDSAAVRDPFEENLLDYWYAVLGAQDPHVPQEGWPEA